MRLTESMWAAFNFFSARWRFSRLSQGDLHSFQDNHIQPLIAYTQKRSAFYRAHWQDHDLNEWRALPTLDKSLLMANFSAFNTAGITKEEAMAVALQAEQSRQFSPTIRGYTVGLSSGTSGHRGLFLVSPREQAAWSGAILARALHESIPLLAQRLFHDPIKVAFFLRSNSNLYESTRHFIHFRYFDLMTPLAEAIVALNAFQPEILIGPPSLLTLLAEQVVDRNLRVRLKQVISVAEVLEPQDREYLEASLGVPIHQIYQCTEGLISVTCKLGRLHVQEDIVATQYESVADHSSESTSQSLRVTPIVTDLWRRTQPIIRYRLNDIWQLDDQLCPCGSSFQVIKAVEGRQDDTLFFSGRPVFPDTIRRMILLASDEIEDYEAVQESPGQLRIYLKIKDELRFANIVAATRTRVKNVLAQYGCEVEKIEVELGLPERLPDTKRRRVKNLRKPSYQ